MKETSDQMVETVQDEARELAKLQKQYKRLEEKRAAIKEKMKALEEEVNIPVSKVLPMIQERIRKDPRCRAISEEFKELRDKPYRLEVKLEIDLTRNWMHVERDVFFQVMSTPEAEVIRTQMKADYHALVEKAEVVVEEVIAEVLAEYPKAKFNNNAMEDFRSEAMYTLLKY